MEDKKPKEKEGSKAKCDRKFPNAWNYGVKAATALLCIWVVGWGLISLGTYFLGNFKNPFSGWSVNKVNNGLPVCDGAADVILSEDQPRIEQKQSYNCLSGLVLLPANIEFDHNVPGDTKVFACTARGCKESFSIKDLDGRRDVQDRKFPRSFRLLGHPGVSRFRLKNVQSVPSHLGRPREMEVEIID